MAALLRRLGCPGLGGLAGGEGGLGLRRAPWCRLASSGPGGGERSEGLGKMRNEERFEYINREHLKKRTWGDVFKEGLQWLGLNPGVAIGGLGMALWGVMITLGGRRNKIMTKTQFHENTFVSDSLSFLREHEKATFLLGYPIREHSIDYMDTANTFRTDQVAVVRVPVTGGRGAGHYCLRAEPDGEGVWRAVRCELELTSCTILEEEKWRNKKLVVFDRTRDGDEVIAVNNTELGWRSQI